MNREVHKKERLYSWIILILSLLIPAAVGVLYLLNGRAGFQGVNLRWVPGFNAIINSATFWVLIIAWLFVRRKQYVAHKRMMLLALLLSVVFLVGYVAYHATYESTHYGGPGFWKGVYYFLLLTHILLAAAIVPLVLITLFRALTGRYDRHRKIARFTLPVWLYVALTGVLVYLMISPYYGA